MGRILEFKRCNRCHYKGVPFWCMCCTKDNNGFVEKQDDIKDELFGSKKGKVYTNNVIEFKKRSK